jgi:uncharacterized protein YecT (DUF1311 family)
MLALVFLSPAHAQSCDSPTDDAEVTNCALEELQEKVTNMNRMFDKFVEALGPRAAVGVPDEQARWFDRVKGHCGVSRPGNIEATIVTGLDTASALCLARFVEARTLDLESRNEDAKRLAAEYADKDYPVVTSTWGDRLAPGVSAPLGRFNAYYLRSGATASLIATATVDTVSINYPWDEFHKIKSEDFEGYWTGRFQYAKATPVLISVDQSWSRTRVIIDRKLIYDGSSIARVPFVFSPGVHAVEVEFINNWHTTSLNVTFEESVEPLAKSELRSRLQSLAPANTVVQVAAVYESRSQDNTLDLTLAPLQVPVILVLASHKAVHWRITNPDGVEIRAIVYGSNAPGSRVEVAQRGKVPRLLVRESLAAYDTMPRCDCAGGEFHCEGDNLAGTVQTLSSMLGFPVTGFSGQYNPAALVLPAIVVTPEVMGGAKANLNILTRDQAECRKTTQMR